MPITRLALRCKAATSTSWPGCGVKGRARRMRRVFTRDAGDGGADALDLGDQVALDLLGILLRDHAPVDPHRHDDPARHWC